MIKSKVDYVYYLEADRIALGQPRTKTLSGKIKSILFPNRIWEFQKILRKLEYYQNCRSGLISTAARFFILRRYKKLSLMLGFSIPTNVFGPGLSIAHYGTIIINSGAKIGANCRLHACVNIGTEAGFKDKAPSLGNNCYIGPGAKIYGDIFIADGIAIGANAVVNKTFSESNIVIAGVPAKRIREIDTSNFLIPATELLRRNL